MGDVLPVTPGGNGGFTVLELEAPRALVLGSFYDADRECSLPMAAAKPEHYWQTTWAFALEPTAEGGSRLHVRARADYAPDGFGTRLRARVLSLIHRVMEREQLRNLKARAEGRVKPPIGTRDDLIEGAVGAAGILYNLATPFWRDVRGHWGLTLDEAQREYPGDALVATPRWQWTHAIEIAAPAAEIWPWIAQLGQDKAGFYSYQALENLAGCEIQNAADVHPDWQDTQPGDLMRLHPRMPPLEVREVLPDRHLLVCAGLDPATGAAPSGDTANRYVAVSWLFQLEPLANGSTRLISRYRCACSGDVATRLAYGPYIAEAVGFVMDRRMLIGVAERVVARGVTI